MNVSLLDAPEGEEASGHYVDGRDVAAELCREFRELCTTMPEQDRHWTRQKEEPGIAVDTLLRADSVVIRTKFVLAAEDPARVFDECIADPRKAPLFDVFIRDVELVERLDRLSGMYLLRIVTPAGACALPLFHTTHHDAFLRQSLSVWRSVDADEAWRAAHVPHTPPSPLTASAFLSDIAPWRAMQEEGIPGGLPLLGVGASGFLVEPDPADPRNTRIVHILHLTSIANPLDLRLLFSGLHGGHVISNLKHLLRQKANDEMNVWEREERRLEFELSCLLTSPLHDSGWKTLAQYDDRGLRFRFSRVPDGGAAFALRGCFDTDSEPDSLLTYLLSDSPQWNFLTDRKDVIAQTQTGSVTHREYGQLLTLIGASEATLIEVTNTQPDGSKVFAFRSVDFAGAPRNATIPLMQFLPSGIFVNVADGNTIVTWASVVYSPPDPQAAGNYDRTTVFLNSAITITAFCSALQGAISGTKRIADTRVLESQFRTELAALSMIPPPGSEISQETYEAVKKTLSSLAQIAECSGTTRSLPRVHSMRPSPDPASKRSRDMPQDDLVFVSNVVFSAPHATPPLDGRPFLFLKRNANPVASSPLSFRQRLEDPQPLSVAPMMLPQFLKFGSVSTSAAALHQSPLLPMFDNVSDVVVARIIGLLPCHAIASIACTCKRFRDIVRSSPNLWESVYSHNKLQLEFLRSNTAPINHRRACLESAAVTKSWQQRFCRVLAVENVHTSRVNTLLFADKGRCLVSGGSDRIVKIWKSGGQGTSFTCINTFSGVKAGVVGMSVSDRLIYAGYRNGQVRIWDVVDWKLLFSHQPIHKTEGYLFIHPQMVSWDEEIHVWDEETAKHISTLAGHSRKVVGVVEYTPDTLVSCALDRTIRLWDKRTAFCHANIRGLTTSATALGLILHHNLTTCGSDGSVHIWDMRQLSVGPLLILREHRGPVRCLKYSCGRLVTGSDDSTVRVWSADTFRCQQIFVELAPISCLDVSSNALCIGTSAGNAKIFEFPPYSVPIPTNTLPKIAF